MSGVLIYIQLRNDDNWAGEKMTTIGVMGDLHYDATLNESSKKIYAKILDNFFSLDTDYHVSLGDLTQNGAKEEIEDINRMVDDQNLDRVLGNQDLLTYPKSDVLSLMNDARYKKIELDDAQLLFIDTTNEQCPEDPSGCMDDIQLNWLEHELMGSSGKPAIIFAHHPMQHTTKGSDHQCRSIKGTDALQSILKNKNDPVFFFSGHNNKHSIVQEGSMACVQTAAVLSHPSYRMITIDSNQIYVKTVPITNKTVLEYAHHSTNPMSLVKGFRAASLKDLSLTINFEQTRAK